MITGTMSDFCRVAVLVPGKLFMTGCPETVYGASWEQIAAAGVDTVVNLYGSSGHKRPDGFFYVEWRFVDGDEMPDPRTLEALVDSIVLLIRAGRKVLVHCQAGLNRSGLVAALVLMRLEGFPADQAIARVRKQRHPLALFNQTFVRYLEALDL